MAGVLALGWLECLWGVPPYCRQAKGGCRRLVNTLSTLLSTVLALVPSGSRAFCRRVDTRERVWGGEEVEAGEVQG